MPWYLILVSFGLILGALADRALIVLSDYLTRRPVTPAQVRLARTDRPCCAWYPNCSCGPEMPPGCPVAPQGRGAADILGYNDLGGRYIAPTHPVTRGARNSVAALAAWDRRNRREVA